MILLFLFSFESKKAKKSPLINKNNPIKNAFLSSILRRITDGIINKIKTMIYLFMHFNLFYSLFVFLFCFKYSLCPKVYVIPINARINIGINIINEFMIKPLLLFVFFNTYFSLNILKCIL